MVTDICRGSATKIQNFSQLQKYVHQLVEVSGWIEHRRLLGKLIFLKLRRNDKRIQIVIHEQELIAKIKQLKNESVVTIIGKVQVKKAAKSISILGQLKLNYEIYMHSLIVLNECCDLPFPITGEIRPTLRIALQYRYLEMRTSHCRTLLMKRSQQNQVIRTFFLANEFLEIETPYLTEPSPEGANEFYIPFVRENTNIFSVYSLAQSPQIYKQLLMCGGVDKYFQIARCFRNEDLRENRQPEFTQLDFEFAFATTHDVYPLVENLLLQLFEHRDIFTNGNHFERLSYADAVSLYGTDKPDLRYDYKIIHIVGSRIPKNVLVLGLIYDTVFTASQRAEIVVTCEQKQISSLSTITFTADGEIGANEAITFRHEQPHKKGLLKAEDLIMLVKTAISLEKNLAKKRIHHTVHKIKTLIYISRHESLSNDMKEILCWQLGQIRTLLTKFTKHPPVAKFYPVWITDFPLFVKSRATDNNGGCVFKTSHHPFTQPVISITDEQHKRQLDFNFLLKKKTISTAFDLVINGVELGSGSERIYNHHVQLALFKMLASEDSKSKVAEEFSPLLAALRFGMPPSVGMAIGLDRLFAMVGTTAKEHPTMRDVIAFPKNKNGRDGIFSARQNIKNCTKEIKTIQKILQYAKVRTEN